MNPQPTTAYVPITDHDVISAMSRYGGGFASRLAQAWFHADNRNSVRLRLAFPELWDEYAKLAALTKSREVHS